MIKKTILSLLLCAGLATASANDGSGLWLPKACQHNAPAVEVTTNADGETADLAVAELKAAAVGMKRIALTLDGKQKLGEGYRLQTAADGTATITASQERGLLYGAYDLLRRMQEATATDATPIKGVDVTEQPAFKYRLLNHWDNLDGSIERGYAGKSILWNADLMHHLDRLRQYARANASIGINGTVVNNVNSSPKMLTKDYIDSVKIMADELRPWGIKVYISVNFGSPVALGDLPTADPLNKKVQAWWKQKAKEIYRLIPDFGGFLVKANSEGQPGPFDYGRSHADGANMLADALKPYGGIVMWRSFVYGSKHKGEDRVKQAVSEFAELDGKFRSNVILQSKNGPLDFQPREPYAPIFDNIKATRQAAEWQITQEYLGQSKHLVFHGPMWKEFFSYVNPSKLEVLAGVANIGDDKNFCGHDFSQANWYCFGRLAWNPELTSEQIAAEWLKLTFGTDARIVEPLKEVMMASREACVDYMMPLGLHHIFKADHHMGPGPGEFFEHFPIEWCPVYYHKADAGGVGFDRSSRGSDAVSQYREPYRSMYDNIDTCPENLLLWFHHVPWTHKMHDGTTLWQSLNAHYNRGVSEVHRFHGVWLSLEPLIEAADRCESGKSCCADESADRWNRVNNLLMFQEQDAQNWRDVCLGYFQTFSHQPFK